MIFLRAALGWKVWLFCVESNCLPKLSTDEKSTLQPFPPKFQVLFALSFREGEIYEVSSFPSSLGWIIPMWWPWWLCFSCTAWARSILVSQFMFILYNIDSYSIHSSVDLPCFHLHNLKLALSCESTHWVGSLFVPSGIFLIKNTSIHPWIVMAGVGLVFYFYLVKSWVFPSHNIPLASPFKFCVCVFSHIPHQKCSTFSVWDLSFA